MEGLRKGLDKALKWPDDEKRPTLHSAIANLVTRVWRKKLPNVPMPRDGVNDLKGIFSMLSENIDIMIAESAKKARVQGLEQGNAAMFKTMVTIRFGSVPDHIAAQIDAASADQLVEWGKRLFVASSLEAVFSAN